jgi:membrane associated rhomboid family serine protease
MVGLVEIVLFLLPFGVFALWRVLAPHASRLAVAGALLAMLVLAVSAVTLYRRSHLEAHQRYVPATTMPDGRVVQGHAAP